ANGLGAGAVVVNNGGQVTINNAGTATTVTGFTLNPGGTLLVDNTASNTNNRLGTSTALNLAGGTFTLTGTTTLSTDTAEQVGAVNVQGGFSTVNLNKGSGGNLTLSAAGLSQTGTGAVVDF